MCGICGIHSTQMDAQRLADHGRLMRNELKHRGPEAEGEYLGDTIYLGHRRLKIIDTSDEANQPQRTSDGRYELVFNGEIYNFRDIKAQLGEYTFHTQSDTEVLLAAYQKWGKDALGKLEGMYAFAIVDTHEDKLFIARDRLGIKPLYYHEQNGSLYFSSEIRSLLKVGWIQPKLNRAALPEYIQYQTVNAPNTLIEDVYMLPPGHYMEVGEDVEIRPYWELPTEGIKEDRSDAVDKVRALLFDAVEKRLVSDVPFGAFLSGGIDSSSIVAIMSEVMAVRPSTFSVVFDEADYSEQAYSDMIAKKYNTDHHQVFLKAENFLELVPDALDAFDHPSGDGPNTYVVSQACKNSGLTVALSGLGGDELFAGYPFFKQILQIKQSRLRKALPSTWRTVLVNILSMYMKGARGEKLKELMSIGNYTADLHAIFRKVWTDDMLRHLDMDPAEVGNITSEKLGTIGTISQRDITTYMQNVLLRDADQMSMAHALEIRVPFLDYRLVEYVMSLPDDVKYPHTPKKLLVDAMGDLLPAELVNRKKMGFVLPWEHWMKYELKAKCETGLGYLKSVGVMDEGHIDEAWSAFLKGSTKYTWSRLWHLVVLGYWMEKNGIS